MFDRQPEIQSDLVIVGQHHIAQVEVLVRPHAVGCLPSINTHAHTERVGRYQFVGKPEGSKGQQGNRLGGSDCTALGAFRQEIGKQVDRRAPDGSTVVDTRCRRVRPGGLPGTRLLRAISNPHADTADPKLERLGLPCFFVNDGHILTISRCPKHHSLALIVPGLDRLGQPKRDRRTDAVAIAMTILRRPTAIAVSRRRFVLEHIAHRLGGVRLERGKDRHLCGRSNAWKQAKGDNQNQAF